MTTLTHDPATDATIAVDNPATGERVGHIENMTSGQVEDLVTRACRPTRLGRTGFRWCAKLRRKPRSWFVAYRSAIIDTVVAENGKTREDASLAECFYLADSMGFWAKNAGKYLAEEKVRTHSPFLWGKSRVPGSPRCCTPTVLSRAGERSRRLRPDDGEAL